MSTRSTYRFRERYIDEKTGKTKYNDVALVYVQCDGYPSGHPADTAAWLATGIPVNGIGLSEKKLVFNGIGCLAAQFIARMKDGAGGTYMHAINSRGYSGENYTYDVIIPYDKEYKPGNIIFIAYHVSGGYGDKKAVFKKLWEGEPKDFAEYLKLEKQNA